MKKIYIKLKKHLLSDNFFTNLFYIDRPINDLTFFIATILRLSLLSYLSNTFFNLIILVPIAIYISYNTIKPRVQSITNEYKILSILLTIFWTTTIIFSFRYLTIGRLFGAFFSMQSTGMTLPFIQESTLVIKLLAAGWILSSSIMVLSIILLSLVYGKSCGNKLFNVDNSTYYSQRRYLNTGIKIYLINIALYIVFVILIILVGIENVSFNNSSTQNITILLFLIAIFNIVAHFYNTSNRIKDFGLSRAWSILLFLLSLLGVYSNPISTYFITYFIGNLTGGANSIAAHSMYIGPIIDLITAPIYHLTLLAYFILMFIPGRKFR